MSSDLPHDYLDRILNTLWERSPGSMLRLALGDPHLTVRSVLEGKRVLLRRDVDGAAIIEDEHGPCVGHIEYETDADPSEIPARMGLYGAMLHAQTGLPVRSAVLVLERMPKIPEVFEMRHGPDLISTFHFRVVYLCQIPAADLAADPNLAVLAPLGLRASLDDVVAARDTLTHHLPRAEQADRLAALYIVGGRRFDEAALHLVLSEEQLMESVTYRAIIEKGIEKGVVKGRRLALRAFVERLVERRFPGAAVQIAPLLDRCSADELETVGEAVVTAPSVEALSRVIAGVLEESGG